MFIYVMDTESKDVLISRGYKLLKYNKNENRPVWIFENKADMAFEILDVPHVASNVMTF